MELLKVNKILDTKYPLANIIITECPICNKPISFNIEGSYFVGKLISIRFQCRYCEKTIEI